MKVEIKADVSKLAEKISQLKEQMDILPEQGVIACSAIARSFDKGFLTGVSYLNNTSFAQIVLDAIEYNQRAYNIINTLSVLTGMPPGAIKEEASRFSYDLDYFAHKVKSDPDFSRRLCGLGQMYNDGAIEVEEIGPDDVAIGPYDIEI